MGPKQEMISLSAGPCGPHRSTLSVLRLKMVVDIPSDSLSSSLNMKSLCLMSDQIYRLSFIFLLPTCSCRLHETGRIQQLDGFTTWETEIFQSATKIANSTKDASGFAAYTAFLSTFIRARSRSLLSQHGTTGQPKVTSSEPRSAR